MIVYLDKYLNTKVKQETIFPNKWKGNNQLREFRGILLVWSQEQSQGKMQIDLFVGKKLQAV
jgi:hypothetical protein